MTSREKKEVHAEVYYDGDRGGRPLGYLPSIL
jgi:hypothetical protein